MKRQPVEKMFWYLVPALLFLVLPQAVLADPGNQYCITPPFVTSSVKPNLLLMIDNSASMYDLAYVDKGMKRCAANSGTSCKYDTDCPSGDTCSIFDRQPYYCYDETYSNANTYTGYFDPATHYYYRSASDDFAVLADFSTGCPGAAGETVQSIANTMCVQYVTASGTMTKFAAKGNYLNWLTASKLDVQKQILTGGKWDGTGIQGESRGCVGQGYVKQALTADFVNYAGSADNDGNVSMPVTFTITGPSNPNNASAPSTGGSSYINLFAGKVYRYADCQAAVDALANGGNADIKQSVAACLTSSSPSTGYCQQKDTQSCTTSSDCNLSSSPSAYVCTGAPLMACTGTSDDTSCSVPARSACSLDSTRTCTSDANCQVNVAEKLGSCGSWSPALPNGAHPPTSCRANADCSYTKSGKSYSGTCSGYTAASTGNYGTCVSTPAGDFGPCVAKYTGPCVLPGGTALVKTKVSFQQSMQACWQLRNGHAIGNDDINTVKTQCSDVYGNFATCSNNHNQTCTSDANCGAGTCQTGPAAIAPGNPALLCGESYEGQYYSKNAAGAWVLSGSATNEQMIATHTQFCNDMSLPNVTDPTDAPSDTNVADNLPAIISGVGVEAQLGLPVGRMRVKVATATAPTGLVQQFGNQIRLGAMTFNDYGSASETASLAAVHAPKVCSDNALQVCTQPTDCASNSCVAAGNLDGGKIIYPIGLGLCATMVGTVCSADADCSDGNSCLNGYCGTKGTTICTTVNNCSGANQACIPNSVGAHTAGTLSRAIDDVVAKTWTPFSEAFFNAIGYFAQLQTGANAGKSRIDLRLNAVSTTSTDFTGGSAPPIDFNEALNPSEFRCQQNYTLLISDGSSTADRNGTVNALASLYAGPSGITQTTCTGAATGSNADYGGTNNLPILAWLAKNRSISTLLTSGSASTAVPASARDSITSYVVFNGESNGAAGDCNSLTLLSKTATKGGTTLKQASRPDELRSALTSVFTDVAAKAASGTAASILSNSEGSGANILQAVFYPKKIFENQTAVNWVGEMQNLWYYVDPLINNSTIREDSNGDRTLSLRSDYVTRFAFDNSADKVMVQLYQDTNGDGTGDTASGAAIDPDYVKSIWRGGKLLWSRNIATSPRKLYTSVDGSSLTYLASANYPKTLDGADVASTAATLAPYLNVAGAEATKLIDWVHGAEQAGYRGRTVDIKDPITGTVSTGIWRLGDIISSTPRVQSTVRLGTYNMPTPGGYGDESYLSFINSNQYKNRGMVYVGANDGMLHAFNLGLLSVQSSGDTKATLTGSNLGKEMWAFVPKSFLPYLRYTADPDYQHLYAVDGRTVLVDASIGDTNNGACVKGSYWLCNKISSGAGATVTDSSNNLDPARNTWRTVVIGGMGLGGASAKAAGTNNVVTPLADPDDITKGFGYSSYFALDVTDPLHPAMMWEFNDPALGFATTGPAIVRLGDSQKNGRWFAVFGSGPTGPIDTGTHQFQGRSNQTLKFFVVDLRSGTLVKTIDTGIADAFAGSLIGGPIDADRWNNGVSGNYQDEAIYVGYVKKATTGAAAGTWTDGGVIRIMTHESLDPNDGTKPWSWSKVIDGIGPVTTSIARLQDKRNRNLWLYGGTGRYYYRDNVGLDDYNGARLIFGIKEPCYNKNGIGNYLDKECSDTIGGALVDQSTSISTVSGSDPGWKIGLDAATTAQGAERMVTDTVALTNGSVFFTTFKPTMDLCGYGGDSFLWGVKYDTGDRAPASALVGKALIQLSTGEFREVDLATAFTDRLYRRMATPMTGKPPSDAPPVISSSANKPVKKILHIQEH